MDSITLILTLIAGIGAGIWWLTVIGLAAGLQRDRKTRSAGADSTPSVSVIVAMRNEETNCRWSVESLAAQDYPADRYEIVIVDDHSEDGTYRTVSDFIRDNPTFILLSAPDPAPGVAPKKSALLHGIAHSHGEIILTTDADCRPPKGWISAMTACFSPSIRAVVGYSPLTGNGLVRFDGFVNAVVSAGSVGLGSPTTAVGRNFAFTREAFDAVGGYGEGIHGASGDDDLLLQRVSKRYGGDSVTFCFDPASFVPAAGQPTVADWWRMKRRHLSAGKRYPPSLIILSSFLYIYNVLLLWAAAASLTGALAPIAAAILWGGKLICDGIALGTGAVRLKTRGWFLPFLLGELVSPLIIAVLVPASLVGTLVWKGRKLAR